MSAGSDNAQGLASQAYNLAAMAAESGMLLSTSKGDRGPGYDNTGPIHDWFTAVNNMNGNKGGYLAPWATTVSQTIDISAIDLTDCSFFGAQEASQIVGSAAYATFKFGNLYNAVFDGMGFASTYANTTEDTGSGLIFSYQKSVKNSGFRRCYFTNPTAFSNAISIYALINASDSGNYIDGLFVEECIFDQVGRMAFTAISRATNAPDPYANCRNITIGRNRSYGTGLAAPVYSVSGGLNGMFCSIDGVGEKIYIDDNYIENPQGVGIELVAYTTGYTGAGAAPTWRDARIAGNKFKNVSRGVNMLSIDNHGISAFSGLDIHNNGIVGSTAGSLSSNILGLGPDCTVRQNRFVTTGDFSAAAVIGYGAGFYSENNSYTNAGALTGGNAVIVQSGGYFISESDTFSCIGPGTYSVIRFSASSGSVIRNPVIALGSAGNLSDQIGGASGNVILSARNASNVRLDLALSVTVPDANYVVGDGSSAIVNYESIDLGGTLTAPRSVTFTPREDFNPVITNNTNQALIINTNTYLYPNQRVTFNSKLLSGSWSFSASGSGYFASGYNAGYQGLFIGATRVYLDTNLAMRLYYTSVGAPAAATTGTPIGLVASGTLASIPITGLTPGQEAYGTNVRAVGSGGVLEASGSGTGAKITWNGSIWRVAGTNFAAST